MKTPLAIRSSSLLEDALERPFAGVYATKMIPNNQFDRGHSISPADRGDQVRLRVDILSRSARLHPDNRTRSQRREDGRHHPGGRRSPARRSFLSRYLRGGAVVQLLFVPTGPTGRWRGQPGARPGQDDRGWRDLVDILAGLSREASRRSGRSPSCFGERRRSSGR